jgi:hypothetical protein
VNVFEALDKRGEVTRVSGEAQIALEAGDTPRSARLFVQAGQMLEAAVARIDKASERDLARFLAATHYYKGGAYHEAARVCGNIQGRRLPSRVRHLYPPFLKDVKERSDDDYAGRFVERVRDLYQRVTREGDHTAAQEVIDLLIAHPYLFPRDRMAHMRARCCDVLGHRRAATLFYRDAWRFNPDNRRYLAGYLKSLCKEGRRAEAKAIVDDEANREGIERASRGRRAEGGSILEDRPGNGPEVSPYRGYGTAIDQDLGGEDLKVVRYRIVFTKPGLEVIFKEEQEIINYATNGGSLGGLKLGQFMGRVARGEVDRPDTWMESGNEYPPGATGTRGWQIPEEDLRYIEFQYEVIRREPWQGPDGDRDRERVLSHIDPLAPSHRPGR